MRFEAHVEVTHLPGMLDPQGATVERALPALGYTNVSEVRIGKSIRLVVDAADEAAARAQVEEMCQRLLANPVIEAFTVELQSLETPSMSARVGVVRLPRHELRARRRARRRAPRRRRRARVARRSHRRRRRRRRRARRLRPRRLPAHRRDRPVLAGDGRRRATSRPTAGRSSGSATASRCSPRPGCCRARCRRTRASSSSATTVVCRVETSRSVLTHGVDGRHRAAAPDQPLRGQLHVRRRRPSSGCGPRTGSCCATSTTPTAASTTSRAQQRGRQRRRAHAAPGARRRR